jgi:putative aminopeptidase FrvX
LRHGARLPILCLALIACARGTAFCEDLSSLRALVRAQGVSGREEPVRNEILSRLPKSWSIEVDSMGNLLAVSGSGHPQRLLLAAMDEPGYVVTRIQDDGYLRVRRTSRLPLPPLFDQYFVGQPLRIGSDEAGSALDAVSAVISTHLQRGRRTAPTGAVRDEDLLVDMGARTAEQAQAAGVRLLAPVTLDKDLLQLAGSRITGFALDDRVGCEVLLRLAQELSSVRVEGQLILAWTAQSWVGARGAARLARRFTPDEILLIDAYVPDAATQPVRAPAGTPGRGPLLARDDINVMKSKALRERLRIAARQSGIAIQQVTVGSQHDAVPFKKSSAAMVGIPVRFPSTPVEEADLRDLDGLIRWLTRYLGAAP